MNSRRNKRAKVVSDDEEEVLEVEEDGPLTMWDLPFDVAAVPDVVRMSVFDAAPFLHGRGKARYDAAFFQHTLGLSNNGYKLSELSSDKVCNKSSFLEVWPMRDGRHYIQDCEDKVQAETYAAMHVRVYGSPPDNNTLGTAFLRACHLHFQEKKAVNWAEKAEALQKGRERQASRNPGKLTPPALRSQIEAFIACLGRAVGSGDEASSREADHVGGSNATAAGSLGDHPQARRSLPTHAALERAGSTDPAVETRRRDAKSRLLAPKTPSAVLLTSDGAGSKPHSRPGSSAALKAAPPPRTKALHTLEGTRGMRAQIEQDMLCLEELREQTEKDLGVVSSLLIQHEEEESRLCETHSELRAASKAASVAGNTNEKRRLDSEARRTNEEMSQMTQKIEAAQGRIEKKEKTLSKVVADIDFARSEVGRLSAIIDRLTLQSATFRPIHVFTSLPTEFRQMPIQVSDPCPLCHRFFVETACVPLTCGCLVHPHCMLEGVMLWHGTCPRCNIAASGCWLGQWGFPLTDTATAEIERMKTQLEQGRRISPTAKTKKSRFRTVVRPAPLPAARNEPRPKKVRLDSSPPLAALDSITGAVVVYQPLPSLLVASNTTAASIRDPLLRSSSAASIGTSPMSMVDSELPLPVADLVAPVVEGLDAAATSTLAALVGDIADGKCDH